LPRPFEPWTFQWRHHFTSKNTRTHPAQRGPKTPFVTLSYVAANHKKFFSEFTSVEFVAGNDPQQMPQARKEAASPLSLVFRTAYHVTLVKGDIVDERVDAIVNAANSRLDHGGGVAGAIRARAGQGVITESQNYIATHGDVPVGGVATTSGGALRCQRIIHTVGPIWGKDLNPEDLLKQAVRNTLNEALKINARVISIPALSSGIFGFPVPFAAAVILHALFTCLSQPASQLSVRIVIIDDPTFNDFRQVFDEFSKISGASNDVRQAHPGWDTIVAKYRAKYPSPILASNRAPVPAYTSVWSWRDDDKKYYGFDAGLDMQIEEAYKRGQAIYSFRMDSQKYKGGAEYEIKFATMTQTNSSSGFSRQLLRDDKNIAGAMQRRREEDVASPPQATLAAAPTTSVPAAPFPMSTIVIMGTPADLGRTSEQIKKRLGDLWKQDIVALDTTSLTPSQRRTLEQTAARFETQLAWNSTQIIFKGLDTSIASAKAGVLEEIMKIRQATSDVAYPPEWTPQSGPVELVLVQAGTPEWNKVAAIFAATLDISKLREVTRIQNKLLWRKYVSEREAVRVKSGAPNELLLFHGCGQTNPESIFHGDEGFDMRFSKAGMWGTGTYFATNASYSSQRYATQVQPGLKTFFLATVITGDTHRCAPDASLRLPPQKVSRTGLKNERYDSVSGNSGSEIIIIYDNKKAYPSYLITFQA